MSKLSSIIRPANAIPRWPFTINRQSEQARGLVGWYPFGDGGGNLCDLISNQRATVSGTCSVSSQLLNVPALILETPATGGYYSLPDPLPSPTEVSASMWVQHSPAAYSGLPNAPFQLSAIGNDTYYPYSDGLIYCFWFRGVRVETITPLVDLRTPHLITVVSSASANTWTLYQNGQVARAETYSASGSLTQATIGTNYAGVQRWNGLVADFRLYNRALTASEVWALYDPATRYELYQGTRRTYFLPSTTPSNTRVSDFNIAIGAV